VRSRLTTRLGRLVALLLLLDPSRFGLATLFFGHFHAVRAGRNADENPGVARKPGVLAPEAVDLAPVEGRDLEGFVLLERVLLQLLPVVVAPRQHLLHEGVEVSGSGR